ncbi:MAG: XRE family transcriptional regulator [Pseudomonas putida]|nr:MAG: XRE family transcriptional regulator [Pseudomonas putida]
MKKLAEIISEARKRAGLSQSELARRLGLTPQAVQAWESGRSTPKPLMLVDIAEALNISLEDLVSTAIVQLNEENPGRRTVIVFPNKEDPKKSIVGNAEYLGPLDAWDDDTPLDDDEVYVPFLKEVELSAGSGRTVVEQSRENRLRFGKRTLRRQGVQPSEAVCVSVTGNSMEPVLPDKSTVGVDRGTTSVIDGKMYAIDHDGQLRVKTLYRLPGGGIRMRSFNRDEHPDEEYTAEEMAEKGISILGKVFWSSVLW